jgi:hypothetical protein
MEGIKDVTSTTFGLIIAYLLPGLTAFYAMSFWSLRVENWFDHILSGDASFGLSMFVIFGAIVIGLQLQVARWLVFECLICRDCRFDENTLARVSDAEKFPVYRLLVDEQLRYHQFWGAMLFAQPLLFWGWLATQKEHKIPTWLSIILMLSCEIATFCAAITSLKRYVSARRNI